MLEWACHLFNGHSVNMLNAYYVLVTLLGTGDKVLGTIIKYNCLLGMDQTDCHISKGREMGQEENNEITHMHTCISNGHGQ